MRDLFFSKLKRLFVLSDLMIFSKYNLVNEHIKGDRDGIRNNFTVSLSLILTGTISSANLPLLIEAIALS
jgi:hypothetical protein